MSLRTPTFASSQNVACTRWGSLRSPQPTGYGLATQQIVYFEMLNPDGNHHWKKPRKLGDGKKPIGYWGE